MCACPPVLLARLSPCAACVPVCHPVWLAHVSTYVPCPDVTICGLCLCAVSGVISSNPFFPFGEGVPIPQYTLPLGLDGAARPARASKIPRYGIQYCTIYNPRWNSMASNMPPRCQKTAPKRLQVALPSNVYGEMGPRTPGCLAHLPLPQGDMQEQPAAKKHPSQTSEDLASPPPAPPFSMFTCTRDPRFAKLGVCFETARTPPGRPLRTLKSGPGVATALTHVRDGRVCFRKPRYPPGRFAWRTQRFEKYAPSVCAVHPQTRQERQRAHA